MTTRLMAGLIAAALCMTVNAAEQADKTAAAVMQNLKKAYPKTTFRSVADTPIPGVYEVIMGKNVAYVDATGKYFLFGHLFDMQTQKDLTADKVPQAEAGAEAKSVDYAKLPLADAVVTKRGNGSRELVVFSDPDCPYCRTLEKTLEQLDNVTIYTFLMPLAQLHPQAATKAMGVWCASDRAKAWGDLMLRGKEAPAEQCDNPLARIAALAESLGIQGTPTIIFKDGTILPGAAPRERLEQLLANTSAAGKVAAK